MGIKYKHGKDSIYYLPVFNAGSDISSGAFMKKGPTGGTNTGVLIPATGTSAVPNIIGRILAKNTFATDGETLQNGTAFVTKPIQLAHPFSIHRIEYDLTSNITCTQAVTTTTITVTSLEDDIDQAFLYVAAGTGIGQTNFLTASAAGSATLKAAFGTSLDTTSKFVKVLPRFHTLTGLTSDGTKLTSQAAAGAVRFVVIDTYIERNGRIEQMDPTKHAALAGMNSLRSFRLWADIAVVDTIPYAIA